MPSILLVVFVVQLCIHLINTVGAATVNNLLWSLYSRIVLEQPKMTKVQAQLKGEFLKVRQELNATSSQDEFAKWAKLRREHDKLLARLEEYKTTDDGAKAKFDSRIGILRWLGTNGLRMFLQFWYSKQAMFWIPKGWVPYYAEWLLSFPRAPLGSVSVQAWVLACGAVILLVSDALIATIGLSKIATTQSGKGKPMKVPIKAAAGEKKEL